MTRDIPAVVCIDASVFLRVLLPDEQTPEAIEFWEELTSAGRAVIAPHLFIWECANAILRAFRQGRLDLLTAENLLGDLGAAPIKLLPVEDKTLDAWRSFIIPFDMPAAYDACYLALAHEVGCELWTADLRLYRRAGQALSWVVPFAIDV